MSELFPVPDSVAKAAHIDKAGYQEMYQRSVDDPEAFWAEQAKRLEWMTLPTKIKNVDYADNVRIRWYETFRPTASIATSEPAAIRPPSFGKVTIRIKMQTSPTRNCMRRSAGSPMS